MRCKRNELEMCVVFPFLLILKHSFSNPTSSQQNENIFFLNIHSIIFQFQRSVGSWQSIATVEFEKREKESQVGFCGERKKNEKR
jgi:hypothetical protein